jgi:hypothetical protein
MPVKLLNVLSIIFLMLIISNCSTRNETPVKNDDEGIISFSPKQKDGINAEIILYKGIDEPTGLPLIADSFTLSNDANVYAEVKLNNYKIRKNRDLMFHVDWIRPDGNSIFMKRVDISQNDSTGEIKSAISISPGKRDTGNYKFRVYLFRELIAEKKFLLASYNVDSAKVFSSEISPGISAEITLGSKYDKKNDFPVDTGKVFTIRDKAKLFANIKLLNGSLYEGKELICDISWCYSNDSSFFSKRINFSQYDKISDIKSNISINRKSRQPGKYKLQVYLYGNLIGEKSFELVSEKKEEIKISKIQSIDASITLYGKFHKKTKKYLDSALKFVIKSKARVYAKISLTDKKGKKGKSSRIKVEWIGPDSKTFYKKISKYTPKNSAAVISSSISISPSKRKPGLYKCRVFYNSSLICEKKFNLVLPSK